MSLITCMQKAGAFLHSDDRAALTDRVHELITQGVDLDQASRQAVQERVEHLKGMAETAAAQAAPKMPEPAERADDLRAFGNGAFWAQEGGKLIRNGVEEPGDGGMGGAVVGRTPWIPQEEWFGDMRRSLGGKGLSDQKSIQGALEKAIKGQPLKANERRTVDFIRSEVEDMHARVGRYAPDAHGLVEDMLGEGLGSHDVPDAAMMRRAAQIDRKAYDEASDNYDASPGEDHDTEHFRSAVRDILANEDRRSNQGGEREPGSTGEQPSSAGSDIQPGAGTLNAGLNPAQVLASFRDNYTPFVGVEADHAKPPVVDSAGKPKSPLLDSIQKIFAPAARGDAAELQAGIMRANFGEMARVREVALEKLKKTAAAFDKMPVAENIKFIDAMERGTKLEDPKLAQAAKDLRTLLDDKRDQVKALGKGQLENFNENYFPHMWKDTDAAAALYARRPLTGSGSFLKQRTIPLTTDGLRWRAYDAEGEFVRSFDTEAEAKMAAGIEGRVGAPLTPFTTNPVEMALLKAREMDKYVYGQRVFGEMKDADLARFVPFGSDAAPGWTKINDKVARVFQPTDEGMVVRGDYYAPDEAATLINNHLSPGLQGNAFFDAWRGVGSAMNSLQLGLSLFHVGFTTMDSMVSKVALGMKQVSRGDVLEGAGNVAQGLNPAQPFINIYKGDRLLRAYLGKLDDPDLAPIVDAIQQAGGRVKMDDFYRNTAVNTFKQALRGSRYIDAAKSFLPTVLDRIGAPIFEELVPRQKLGVFFDMAKDWLEKNPDSDVAGKRAGLGKLWDSVDNRMGQLVYDNVFWNHALKDGLMATVRSVGWNLGTFRELGGGLLDIKDIPRNKGFSDRTAYVVALPLVAAIYGSVLHYANTGEAPETLKDAFYPKTGRTRPDGSADRVSLPTYMKDVFAYGEDVKNFTQYGADPTQTLKNKAHPLIATIGQMLSNQDYFGGAIRNPADPAMRQVMDEAAYLVQQIEPFSLRNYMQQAKDKGEEPSALGYLTSPSMVGVAPAPGYMTKSAEQLESAQVSRMREPLIQKYREAIKNGGDAEKLIPEMIAGGLSKADIKYVIKSSGEVPKPAKLKKFGSVEISQAGKIAE